MFPFKGWREKGKITKGFLSRTKKLEICVASKWLLPFSTKHRDQAGPTPKTTNPSQQLEEDDRCYQHAHRVHIYHKMRKDTA